MNKRKHPSDRQQRLLLKEKDEKKKSKAEQERLSKVRLKLVREQAKLQETEDELQRYQNN
jgi:hypothetical protein